MSVAHAPTVLIVDDDRSTRIMLRAELQAAGYRAIEAASGEEALQALQLNACRIVVTDWIMDGLDGPELCRRLRADPSLAGTYVIMITVNDDRPRLVEAFEAGVDDFLPKPFEPGVLLARMRAAVRTVELQDALLARNLELEVANRKLSEIAATDDLTGLANRRHGLEQLRQHWAESRATNPPLTLALVDIDHFKQFNDTHGHMVGDRVIASVGRVLRHACAAGEMACRYGGEEFLIVLPGIAETAAAERAENWRERVQHLRIQEGRLVLGVTVSVGLAERATDHANAADLIRAADSALYTAKREGRNTVRAAA